jgi:predicted nucleotidyltransferase
LNDERVIRALKVMKKMEDFPSVEFIILYGSQNRGDARLDSDVDLAVYYQGSETDASNFRQKVLGELYDDYYDIQIFQQLPLFIQIEALKGEIVFSKDLVKVYDIANQVIKEFEDFKRYYYDYIGEMEIT